MKCFVCARSGSEADALAICPQCGAGLCMGHVADAAQDAGPGGTRLICRHETQDSLWQQKVHAG
jgi:hypothetical protein